MMKRFGLSLLYIALCLWVNILAGRCEYYMPNGEKETGISAVSTITDSSFLPISQISVAGQTISTQGHNSSFVPTTKSLVVSQKTYAPIVRLPIVYYIHFLRRMIV